MSSFRISTPIVPAILVSLALGACRYRHAEPEPLPLESRVELETILGGGAPSSVDELRAMEQHVKRLLVRTLPAVVDLGGASGVIIDDGYVLTAGHVTEEVGREITVRLHDGRELVGQSLGLNEATDTGLVAIDSELELPTLELGSSGDLVVGEWCLLLGHAGGAKPGRSAPARLGRIVRVPETGFLVSDCPMQGGDSGGPLLDMDGRVVGINSRISRNIAENMHTPIDAFRREWDGLVAGGLVEADRTGRPRSERLGVRWDRQAGRARIREVLEGRAFERAGLLPGDVVLQIDGADVADRWEVARRLSPHRRSASEVMLRIDRGGEIVEIALGGLPVVGPTVVGGEIRALRGDGARKAFAPVVDAANRATVTIEQDGEVFALGLVVDAGGIVVTKASALEDDLPVVCGLGPNKIAADRIGADELEDLVFLRIAGSAPELPEFAAELPEPGIWLASADGEGAPLAVGVLSCAAYEHSRKGFLGVTLDVDATPPRITGVTEDSAAELAGLAADDEILAVDGREFANTADLIDAIGKHKPGDEVRIEVRRDGARLALSAVLGQNRNGPRSAQEGVWGALSAVRSGFGTVLQHDAVVEPWECGGPVVDLRGRVVGLNIARAGRVETLALPIATVQASLARVLSLR